MTELVLRCAAGAPHARRLASVRPVLARFDVAVRLPGVYCEVAVR